MRLSDINPVRCPGPGDDEPIEDRVPCWLCEGTYPSDYMIYDYLRGPICERCDAMLMAAEKQETEETT